METLTPIEELRKLRWVEEVKKEGADYLVKTKARSLKTYMVQKISEGSSPWDNGYGRGTLMDAKVPLYLPQYWITLRMNPSYPFLLHLAQKPDTTETLIGMNPQYHRLLPLEEWNIPHKPCYGYGSDPNINVVAEYNQAKTWAERANSAAMYLQAAIPHGSNAYDYYITSFAYRLGLVGKEVLIGSNEAS